MYQAYKVEFDLNNKQATAMRRHVGTALLENLLVACMFRFRVGLGERLIRWPQDRSRASDVTRWP